MSEQHSPDAETRAADSPADTPAVTPAATDAGLDATRPDEPAGEPPEQAVAAPPRAAGRGPIAALLIGVLALLLSVAAAASAFYLWSQDRTRYAALADRDSQTTAALSQAQQTIRELETELAELAGGLETGQRRLIELDDRLDELPDELAAISRRIDAVQGGSFESRDRWLLAETEYYLGLANSELTMADRWDNAITALGLADDRLRELGAPELTPVREAIADELLALRSVRLPDLDGIAFSLSRLSERVDALPLRAGLPTRYDTAPLDETSEPGLTRLWNSAKEALSSLIRIERRDEPVAAALSAEEGALVRRELMVELQLARVAIARRDAADFSASLDAAMALLMRDFDRSAAEVGGAVALLDELGDIEIAPAPPDISSSLSALRRLSPGEN